MIRLIFRLILPAFLLVILYTSFLNYRQNVYNNYYIASFDKNSLENIKKDEENIKQDLDVNTDKNISVIDKTEKKEEKKESNVIASSSINAVLSTKSETISKPKTDFTKINESARLSLVNILCSTKTDGPLSPITGSGIIISKDGLVITNAHIAQYFLLKDFGGVKDFIDCIIRTGSPAYPTYRAKLVYISPDWVLNNKTLLIEKNPKGTGEFDYGFLKITSRIDNASFSEVNFLDINTEEILEGGQKVLVASYPAGFLGGIAILQYLYQSSSETEISDIYTFKQNTVDLISVGGTVVSQKGSSGGAVVDSFGKLLGIISTSGDADRTKDRDLRAITIPYVNRDLKEKTGFDLKNIILDPSPIESLFETKRDGLIKILTDAILN